jgi:hypothetical protein
MDSASRRLPMAIYSTRKTMPMPAAPRQRSVGTRGARPAVGWASCSEVPSVKVETTAPVTHLSSRFIGGFPGTE